MKKRYKVLSLVLMLFMAVSLFQIQDFTVKAAGKEVRRIKVSYEGDDVPYKGSIEKSDFDVTAYYSDGDSKRLSSGDFDISPDYMRSERSQRVTVEYEYNNKRVTASVTVYCEEPELESIEASYNGRTLVVGGTIDPDDIDVYAYYTDGSDKKVTGFTLSSYSLKEGNNRITVTYREKSIRETDEIEVEAYGGSLSYINANYTGGNLPVGSRIDTNKINVTAVYESGSHSTASGKVTNFTLDNYYVTKEGVNVITVTYTEKGITSRDTIQVVGGNTTVAPPSNSNNNTTIPTLGGKWVASGTNWKFLRDSGSYMTSGWVVSSGKWYYLKADGLMAANEWIVHKDKWYYLSGDGSMFNGWLLYKNQWYYLNPGNGDMAVNTWIGNYYVNGDGVWTQTR